MHGNVPEADHAMQRASEFLGQQARGLQDGEDVGGVLWQAEPPKPAHAHAHIDRGLTGPLEVQHDDVLQIDVVLQLRLMTHILSTDPNDATLDAPGLLLQNIVRQ